MTRGRRDLAIANKYNATVLAANAQQLEALSLRIGARKDVRHEVDGLDMLGMFNSRVPVHFAQQVQIGEGTVCADAKEPVARMFRKAILKPLHHAVEIAPEYADAELARIGVERVVTGMTAGRKNDVFAADRTPEAIEQIPEQRTAVEWREDLARESLRGHASLDEHQRRGGRG